MSRRHGLIGASKPYLYKEEDAEFYYRQTSGGVIMNNNPLVGSIDRIKGQTIAWNQLVDTSTSSVATISTRKYYTNVSGVKIIITGDGSAISVTGGTDMLFDLTLIYGEGNEPATPEEFEADYFKWFGKPLTYEPYDEGSLRNVQMEGIKSVGQRNGTYEAYKEDTETYNVTTLTGKLNGEGESVVIFPDGMKGVNDVKDEIYIEDGVTKAVKRVGRVDLGGLDWNYVNGDKSQNIKYFSSSNITDAKPIGGTTTIANIVNSIYKTTSGMSIYYRRGDKLIAHYAKLVRVFDSSYTDTTIFKTAMQGVYLDYELAEPQVYVLDTPLPIVYNCEVGGTEQILPEEISTGIAPIMDITYNIGQINN